MMRTLLAGIPALALPWIILTAAPASAQLLGAMSTAAVEEVGAQKVGGYVGITGDFVALTGQFRLGVASSLDMGVKAAYVDFNSPGGSSLALNADLKIQILDIYLQDPIDLSLGPDVTYFRASDVTNWYFGGFILVSREYALSNGKPLSPYARLGLRLHRAESAGTSTDDFDIGFAGGVEYGLSGYTSVFGEIVIEDMGTGFYVGAQYQLP